MPPVSSVASSPTGHAFVRVNQIGYPLGEPARAYLLTRQKVRAATFELVAGDAVAASGAVGQELGRWSGRFPHVYAIDFSAAEPGTYAIRVRGPRGLAVALVPDRGSRRSLRAAVREREVLLPRAA